MRANRSNNSKILPFPRLRRSSVWLAMALVSGLVAVGCSGSDEGVVSDGEGGAAGAQNDASTADVNETPDTGIDTGDQEDTGSGGSGGMSVDAGDSGADVDIDGEVEDVQPDVFMGCDTLGATRCEGNVVQECVSDGAGGQDWKTTKFCAADTQECKESGTGTATCVDLPTCHDGKKNQDETGTDCGGATCEPCPVGEGCTSDTDCESGACTAGVCKTCKAGTYKCDCGAVQVCNAQESGWTVTKNCTGSSVCDPDKKTCVSVTTVGTSKVTGDYYRYALFTPTNSPLKSDPYDVDSFVDDNGVNWIYINRHGHLYVYTVTIEDSDHDGKIQPNQHPDNPKAQGPMEKRTLKFVKSYPTSSLGTPHTSELYATKDAVFYYKNGNIYRFDLKTEQTTKIIDATNSNANNSSRRVETLAYDELADQWFTGDRSRYVYGICPSQHAWHIELRYPNLAGEHMDGMEIVPDPNAGISYLYVSDMTSDFIAQYYRTKDTHKWVQKNVFKYQDNGAGYVEGMGFGAFNHFWVASGSSLYELGGGALQEFIEPG